MKADNELVKSFLEKPKKPLTKEEKELIKLVIS